MNQFISTSNEIEENIQKKKNKNLNIPNRI